MLFYFAKNIINGGGVSVSQFWKQIGSWSSEWYEVSEKVHAFLFDWFDSLHLINNLLDIKGQVFLGWTINVSCSMTQHSEAWTPGPSVSSQELYHWATAPANYGRRPEFEIMKYHWQIYLSRCQSFIHDVTMHFVCSLDIKAQLFMYPVD